MPSVEEAEQSIQQAKQQVAQERATLAESQLKVSQQRKLLSNPNLMRQQRVSYLLAPKYKAEFYKIKGRLGEAQTQITSGEQALQRFETEQLTPAEQSLQSYKAQLAAYEQQKAEYERGLKAGTSGAIEYGLKGAALEGYRAAKQHLSYSKFLTDLNKLQLKPISEGGKIIGFEDAQTGISFKLDRIPAIEIPKLEKAGYTLEKSTTITKTTVAQPYPGEAITIYGQPPIPTDIYSTAILQRGTEMRTAPPIPAVAYELPPNIPKQVTKEQEEFYRILFGEDSTRDIFTKSGAKSIKEPTAGTPPTEPFLDWNLFGVPAVSGADLQPIKTMMPDTAAIMPAGWVLEDFSKAGYLRRGTVGGRTEELIQHPISFALGETTTGQRVFYAGEPMEIPKTPFYKMLKLPGTEAEQKTEAAVVGLASAGIVGSLGAGFLPALLLASPAGQIPQDLVYNAAERIEQADVNKLNNNIQMVENVITFPLRINAAGKTAVDFSRQVPEIKLSQADLALAAIPLRTVAEAIPTSPIDVAKYYLYFEGFNILPKIAQKAIDVGFIAKGIYDTAMAETPEEKVGGILTSGIGVAGMSWEYLPEIKGQLAKLSTVYSKVEKDVEGNVRYVNYPSKIKTYIQEKYAQEGFEVPSEILKLKIVEPGKTSRSFNKMLPLTAYGYSLAEQESWIGKITTATSSSIGFFRSKIFQEAETSKMIMKEALPKRPLESVFFFTPGEQFRLSRLFLKEGERGQRTWVREKPQVLVFENVLIEDLPTRELKSLFKKAKEGDAKSLQEFSAKYLPYQLNSPGKFMPIGFPQSSELELTSSPTGIIERIEQTTKSKILSKFGISSGDIVSAIAPPGKRLPKKVEFVSAIVREPRTAQEIEDAKKFQEILRLKYADSIGKDSEVMNAELGIAAGGQKQMTDEEIKTFLTRMSKEHGIDYFQAAGLTKTTSGLRRAEVKIKSIAIPPLREVRSTREERLGNISREILGTREDRTRDVIRTAERNITRSVRETEPMRLEGTARTPTSPRPPREISMPEIERSSRTYPTEKIPPFTPFKKIALSSRRKRKRFSMTSPAYAVMLKRRGKFIPIATGLPKGRALKFGSERAIRELSRQFKVVATGKSTELGDIDFRPSEKVFRQFKIRRGRQVALEPDRFIQNISQNLQTNEEKILIKQARRMKNAQTGFLY
jgi:hypothetical protein